MLIKHGLGGFADGSAARAALYQRWSEIVSNKVLVVASGGGHWIQLRRLQPAFDGLDVAYVSVRSAWTSGHES